MTRRGLSAALAVAALAAAPAAHAAPEWSVTPYLWIAGFDGTIGTTGGDSGLGDRVTVDFGSLSDNLSMGGFMLNLNWRDGRWSAFGDWTYAKVESDAPTQVPNLYSRVDGEIKGNIVQGFVGYDLANQRDMHLDVFAGARFYDLDVKLGLSGAALADRTLQGDAQWVDGVVGARWSTRFAQSWEAYVQGDVGAGGSDLSWQAIGALGYKFSWGSVIGGWRYLHVDYEDGPYRLDAALTGPFIGATFRF